MTDRKAKITIALKKARTSIDQILQALESSEEKKCFDIIQQNLAVIGLLKSANILMLESHLESSIANLKNMTPTERKKMVQIREDVVRIVQTAQNK